MFVWSSSTLLISQCCLDFPTVHELKHVADFSMHSVGASSVHSSHFPMLPRLWHGRKPCPNADFPPGVCVKLISRYFYLGCTFLSTTCWDIIILYHHLCLRKILYHYLLDELCSCIHMINI